MTQIMVRCRRCGTLVGTGVDMPPSLFTVADVAGDQVTCPDCDETITWSKADAYFLS